MHAAAVRQLIERRYAIAHGAVPAADFPHFCVVDPGGESGPTAALGFRFAANGRLFLEDYLDDPIEAVVSAEFGSTIDRSRIVEIGAHASDRSRATVALWARTARYLDGVADVAVAVLTAPLRSMLERLGISVHELCEADPARLPDGGRGWGNYYDQTPPCLRRPDRSSSPETGRLRRRTRRNLRMICLLDSIRGHAKDGRRNWAVDDGVKPLDWASAAKSFAESTGEIDRLDFGERPVGLLLDHSTASAILLVAFLEAGVPIIPLPLYFSKAQVHAALDHAGATALVTNCWLDREVVRFEVERRESAPAGLPTGTAVISFSSGSTGAPKGVCLSAGHLIAVATAICDRLGRDLAGRHLPILPFGILLEQVAGLFASLIAGGTYVPLPGARVGLSDPLRPDLMAMLGAIDRTRATSLILVPEYLSALTSAMELSGIRLPRLNLVAVGGASISTALLERAKAVGLPVCQGYGMTEAGSVIAFEGRTSTSTGSVGRSIGAHRITLADDGEIVVDGPLFLGLVGNPRKAGPFATGDIGRFDECGNLWIEGRKSNLIVTSLGRNVSPEWIEGLLTEQPEIAQAMIRGDGDAALEALIVPSGPSVDLRPPVDRVNDELPEYARISRFRPVLPFTAANGQLTANGRARRPAINQAYPKETKVLQFFDRLVAETRGDQAQFAMTPQLVSGLTGQISRADYIAYLTEAYHHVRHTVPLMLEARALLAGRGNEMLVDALDEYIVEETGHEEWILDDIAAAGGDRDAAARSDPSPATKAMVDHAYRTIRNGNPAAFFGMVFVLEGTSIAMASHGAASVQQALGLPKTAFRYLNSHGELDQGHMRFFETLMNRIDDPADQSAIIAMAKDMFALFGGIFAGIELEGARHAA